jgi:hypothetical protein
MVKSVSRFGYSKARSTVNVTFLRTLVLLAMRSKALVASTKVAADRNVEAKTEEAAEEAVMVVVIEVAATDVVVEVETDAAATIVVLEDNYFESKKIGSNVTA